MTTSSTDWRVVDQVMAAWFDAPSLGAGAALVSRLGELAAEMAVDLRPTGLRVRLADGQHAEAVSSAARDLGLDADPTALAQLGVVIESTDPAPVQGFWQRVLDLAPGEDGTLADPWQREPSLRIRRSGDARPLRNRIHLDVSRPAEAVARTSPGPASGAFGVCHRDPDGNEVDLVPGSPIADGDATADWQAVFSAIACYRTSSVGQQHELAAAAATLAEDAGFELLVDLRPGLVVLDSGKDQWEPDPGAPERDFTGLASSLQASARRLGATADPQLPRFTQLFLDAADVAEVRAFWAAALGWTADRRPWVTDVYDPRRLGPVLVFQELDAADTPRRRQRNRTHLELVVPADLASRRLTTVQAAGGRLLAESPGRWRLADPEGNELVLIGEP